MCAGSFHFIGGGVLFSSRCTSKQGERKSLAFLANSDYFVADLRTFWCTFTGLNNTVVYYYGHIRGMCRPPPPTCFRIGGAGDNFILYIEYRSSDEIKVRVQYFKAI